MKKGTIEHLISLNTSIYNGDFLNTPVKTISERYILYGYIEDIDGRLNNWENPKKNGNGNETVTVKIGMFNPHSETYKNMDVKSAVNKRVQEQHSNSANTEYVPVFCCPSFKSYYSEDNFLTDSMFRKLICSKCTKYTNHTEDENVEGLSKENIKRYYNYLLNGINRTENHSMSTPQNECCNKLVKCFENSSESTSYFLLAAKPRFGKNFVILNAIKKLGIKNSLFVSYLPLVFDSLENDVERHVDFDGYEYIDYRNNRNIKDSNNVRIFSSSAQLLNYVEDGLEDEFTIEQMNIFRNSLSDIKKYNIELLVIDEAHFGGQTDNLANIISEIAPKYVIFVTGTASKYANDNRFGEDNTYDYDYIDECNDTDIRAKQMPRIKIYTFNMDKAFANAVRKHYNIDEYFSFSKLFSTKDGKFIQKEYVELFVKAVFGKRNDMNNLRLNTKLNSISPFNNEELENKINHSLVVMPSIDSAKAIIPVIKKVCGDEFDIFNASGSGKNIVKDIKDIRNGIQKAKHNNKKTLTLVCDRFREGVTVNDWSAVFLFEDGHSYDRYIQTMFRVQSSNENKKFCYVFDYNPERCLTIRYENINYYCKKGYSKDEMERILFECMPITYYNSEGNLICNEELKVKIIEYGHRVLGKIFNGFTQSMIHIGEISKNKAYLELLLKDISISNTINEENIDCVTNNFRGGKLYKAIEKIASVNDTLNNKDVKNDYKKLVELCLEVIKHLPEYWYLEGKKYKNVMDSLNGNEELFYEIVGVEISEFKALVLKNFFDIERLDEMMYEFYKDVKDFEIISEYSTDINSTAEVIKSFDYFRNKWIYETESIMKDVPYYIVENMLNCVSFA